MPPFITFNNVVTRISDSPFSKPINWTINKGEIWSVIGPNGSGKSALAKILLGNISIVSGKIDYHFLNMGSYHNRNKLLVDIQRYVKILSMDSTYSLADYRKTYYQQRYNNSEAGNIPFVSDIFHPEIFESETIEQIIRIFKLDELMDRRLIHLSSGELRKLMIAKVMLKNPKMVIFDNPFAGLDVKSCDMLNDIFLELNQLGHQLLFLAPSYKDIPEYTTHILEILDGEAIQKGKVGHFVMQDSNLQTTGDLIINWSMIPPSDNQPFKIAVNMEQVEISYHGYKVCDKIDWTIKKGEKWALLGSNGSGKSTLLSYIFADNPVAYTKNLTLFDRKRGTGESIWEIKQRIGYTSSELHLYYRQTATCLEVVESGFFDSTGIFGKCSDLQTDISHYFLGILNLNHLADKSFLEVSSGEQRMVLFIRSLVKNPDLLILDEPFHGLDGNNKDICKKIVDSFCLQKDKTLIYVTHRRVEIPVSVDHILELGK